MSKPTPILIIEDEPLIAMDLAWTVEETGAEVIGPVATVAAALELMDHVVIAAAIVDARLADRDISPVALRLARENIPFVVYSATGLPDEVALVLSHVPILLKPAPVVSVVRLLEDYIQRCASD